MKAREKLKEITALIKISGVEAPEKEAEMLFRHGLDISTLEMFRDDPELNEKQIDKLSGMLFRRLSGEPFQYIVGHEWFMGLKLEVGPGVLVPRPETELMAEQAIKTVKRETLSVKRDKIKTETLNSQFTVLDLCTGSGCLALAIAKHFPDIQVYGSDISGTAVEYAKRNAKINGITNAVFLEGLFFQPFEDMASSLAFDLIISNPPYISTDNIKDLQPEIRYWEPMIALNGGADGLDFYREMIPSAGRFINDEGHIILEMGADQAENVKGLIKSSGYTDIKTIKDYSGIERIIQATWKR